MQQLNTNKERSSQEAYGGIQFKIFFRAKPVTLTNNVRCCQGLFVKLGQEIPNGDNRLTHCSVNYIELIKK
jgi:hypothetical protein